MVLFSGVRLNLLDERKGNGEKYRRASRWPITRFVCVKVRMGQDFGVDYAQYLCEFSGSFLDAHVESKRVA